ncbi:MAG: acyl-CoA dehydrogenase family protein [Ferroplasma sp.]
MNEENNILKETLIEFCEKNLDENKIESEKITGKVINSIASQGFLGATIPEKYGGSALDEASYNIILEEISRYSPSVAMKIFMANSLYFPAVEGTDAEASLSDVSSGKLNVSVDFINNEYSLNQSAKIRGQLPSILNVDAEKLIIFNGQTTIVNGKMEYSEEDFMGYRGLKFGNAKLDNEYNVLDKNSRKPKIMEKSYKALSAMALGMMSESIKKAMDYTGVRKAFGNNLRDFEPVSFRLSGLYSRENILRGILYGNIDSYYVYNFAMESIVEATRYSLNAHGGYGYFKDFGVEKFYRDAIVMKSLFYGNEELKKLADHAYGEKLNFI